MNRAIAASIAVLAAALVTGSATAASSGADVQLLPAEFSMSSTATNGVPGGCPNLPAGVEISWEGSLRSITVIRLEKNGELTVQNTSVASGKASDEDGNTYAFSYSNQFRISETTPGSGVLTGIMTDHFSLAGNGITLNNGFRAVFTVGPGPFDIALDPIRSFGDPIDFVTGAPLCDPL